MHYTWDDLPYILLVLGIYALLGALSYWGALAWSSWFMFGMGTLWWLMFVAFALYFMFVPPRET